MVAVDRVGQPVDMATDDLVAPYLEAITEDSWTAFAQAYAAYRARGGKRQAVALVSAGARRLLAVRCRGTDLDKLDTDQFLEKVGALFAPKSKLDALGRLRAVRAMGETFSVDGVATTAMAFMDLVAACKDSTPPEEMLVEIFLGKIRPARLRDMVLLRQPKTLDDCVNVTLDEADQLARMSVHAVPAADNMVRRGAPGGGATTRPSGAVPRGRVSSRPGQRSGSPTPRPAGKEETGPTPTQRRTGLVKCYGCGEAGHIKPNCPNRQAWATRKGGQSQVKVTTTQPTDASESEDAGDQPPRHVVQLRTADGKHAEQVVALWDTGASINLVSPAVY